MFWSYIDFESAVFVFANGDFTCRVTAVLSLPGWRATTFQVGRRENATGRVRFAHTGGLRR